MITQASITAGYFRAAYGECIANRDRVVWFGAGEFARRLSEALTAEQLETVVAIVDDQASDKEQSIAGMPVVPPGAIDPPRRVLLATDTYARVFADQNRSLWGPRVDLIDLHQPSEGSWLHPRDDEGGFARAHMTRWREAIGLAQLESESAGADVDPAQRWLRAHELLNNSSTNVRYQSDEHELFLTDARSLLQGQVVTITGESLIKSDPFWTPILSERFVAYSPGGTSAAMTWARRDEFHASPMRMGAALWIPSADRAENRYTVRFDNAEDMEIAVTRERTYADVSGSAELSRYERAAALIPIGSAVLDCASGTGFGSQFLSEQGIKVHGAEIDPVSVAFAQARYPGVQFVCAGIGCLPFDDNAFDAVVCIETLEHVMNPAGAIAELVRVCKPGGVICLSTPGAGASDSPYHLCEFSDHDLRGLLDRVLGAGGWSIEPVIDTGNWHEMLIRPRSCARL